MTKYVKGWKAVDRYWHWDNKKLPDCGCWLYRSCVRTLLGAVKYAVNKISRPNKDCGPLAVFKTRKDAVVFLHTNGRLGQYIARCEYVPSKIKGKLWFHNDVFTNLPKGTMLASKVRLLAEPEKITNKDVIKYVDNN